MYIPTKITVNADLLYLTFPSMTGDDYVYIYVLGLPNRPVHYKSIPLKRFFTACWAVFQKHVRVLGVSHVAGTSKKIYVVRNLQSSDKY